MLLTMTTQTLAEIDAAEDTNNKSDCCQEDGSRRHQGKETPLQEGQAECVRGEHSGPANQIQERKDKEDQHGDLQFSSDGNPTLRISGQNQNMRRKDNGTYGSQPRE